MNKYIKKPVVVEAEELIPANIIKIVNWITETSDVSFKTDGNNIVGLTIPTLKGDMTALIGDYIIRGVNGEFYPCKPYIFHKIYSKYEGGVDTLSNVDNSSFDIKKFKEAIKK